MYIAIILSHLTIHDSECSQDCDIGRCDRACLMNRTVAAEQSFLPPFLFSDREFNISTIT